MGRGLGLNSTSTGEYFAFSAGTGILVFIDLVAKIALGELDLIKEKLHSNFKFNLYASFRNKEEAIGLDLLQNLDNYINKVNSRSKISSNSSSNNS